MAGAGFKALTIVAAVSAGLAPAIGTSLAQSVPVTGYAGSGTADPGPARAGEGAPPHLTGEAPKPGDAAESGTRAGDGVPEAASLAPASAAPSNAAAPDAVTDVIVELPAAPAAPTGLDAPAPAKAATAPTTPASRDVVQDVVIELPAAPAVPTGLEAPATATANATPAAPVAPAQPQQAAPVQAAPMQNAPVQAAVPADPLAPVAQAIARILAAQGPGAGKDQEALAAFYGARADAPLFVTKTGYSRAGEAVIARFAAADQEGLDPADYKVQKLAATPDVDQLAQAELKLAASALRYARHAQAGRFDPSRISASLTPTRTFPDPLAVLNRLALASDAGTALAGYNPPHPGYAALKAKLAEARTSRAPAPALPVVGPGPSIRPGDVDARVPVLRARLGVPRERAAAFERTYDMGLVDEVRAFQSANGLEADGIVGMATLEALNGAQPAQARVPDIIANMERWRWLPRDLGEANVVVNIPEYMVRVSDGGKVIHETRVVVGKPETQTPLLTHDMEYVVVNPSWNVPPSIARKEMLPNLQRDPYYLARQGITIERNGRAIDPGAVNWSNGLGGYSFRQPPGERNALGRIKFMFPNQHSVYLHDTPSRSLFANDRRAYSHGCVRVQDPVSFGEVVFSLGMPGDGWTESKIAAMFGGKERYINLKRHIPVHLVYFTLFVDPSGRLSGRPDIYGLDEKVKQQLGLEATQHMAAGKPGTTTR